MNKLAYIILAASLFVTQYSCAQSRNKAQTVAQMVDNGNFKEAAAAIDQAKKDGQMINSDMLYSYANTYAMAGEKEKALKTLNEAISAGYSDINNLKENKYLRNTLGDTEVDKAVGRLRTMMAPYIGGKVVLSPEEQRSIIALAQRGLKAFYFDDAKAVAMADELGKMFNDGAFKGKDTLSAFTGAITGYLRKQTNDKHFYIGLNYGVVSERVPNLNVTTAEERNFGFREVSVRPGNIGYIRWDECIAGDEAYKTAFSALTMLRNARAIIIDISGNGGGNGEISTFLYHYLFKPDDKRFETLLIKKCKGEPEWHRSEPPVAPLPNGPDLGDKPVYVVTSGNTFSASEYFAFMMKELGRATIIGKNTGGGGNPVNITSSERYIMYVPTCQITTQDGKSLEGKGVAPDIEFKTSDFAREIMEVVNADLKAKGK